MNTHVMHMDAARGVSAVMIGIVRRFWIVLENLEEANRRRAASRELRRLDARLLRDVGLHRISHTVARYAED